MIPLTFQDWKNCLVKDCKIDLTKDFAAQRLTVLQNKNSEETKKFASLYGEQHLSNIINWYKEIAND